MPASTQPESGGQPVTVTVARQVAPGREGEFEEWAQWLTAAASDYPGFLGAGLLRPGQVGQEWHVVYRFDSPQHLANWESSAERDALLDEADHLIENTAIHRVTGLETWFELPGRTAPAPPRWKMFLVSVAGIYSLQLLFNLTVGSALAGWPLALRGAALAGTVTALMTWLVMPRLARLLAPWLYSLPRRGAVRSS
jgi:antibiotic biosynthesis monooxygenase (ABM) superfamily enzyme